MKNYLETKTSSSRSLPMVTLNSKAKLNVTLEFNHLIKYLCERINTIEWSGMLFFKSEGDLNTEDGVVITPIDIYPMDKGSGAYTEYNIDEKVFDYYDHHPDRFGMKYGHIHSHHNMQSYFSGTDNQELMDNCVNHSYYVSVVVNNRNDIVGRIAIPGKRKVVSSSNYSFSGILGNVITIPREVNDEENVMYIVDMDVEIEAPAEIPMSKLFIDKVDELTRPKSFVSTGAQHRIPFNQLKEAVIPEQQTPAEEFEVNEVFKLCLGENVGETRHLSEIFSNILDTTEDMNEVKFFLESCLDLESVTDAISTLQRDFFSQPSIQDILFVYNGIKKLTPAFKHGIFKHLVDIVDEVVDKEMVELKQLSNAR